MGKECTVVWGSRMKTGMCEELDVTGLARLLEMQGRTYDDNCEVQTLHLLQNDGHADSLKATAKEKLLLTGSTYCHSTDSTSIQSMAPSSSENEDTCNRQNCCNSDKAQDIASNDTQSLIQHGVSKNGKASVVCNGSSYNIESLDVCPGDTSSVNRDQGLLQHVHSNDSSSVSEIAGVKDLSNGHGNSHSDSCLNTDLHVNEQGTQDVSVNVGMTNNSRLSRVLENIPLVYIPTTRQLGLMEDVSSIKQVRTHSENNNSEILSNPNCKNAYENVGKDEHKVYRHCESVSIDDDVECVSLNRHYETEYTDTNTCNTKSTVRDGGVKADNTSFSSVSSISTGPEVSWAAPNQENADVQKKTVGGDEDSDFMEINLHSRNSYEPTRTPVEESLPEEIHDSHDNGARPKKKSLSGFLSRNLFSRKPKDGGPGYESAPGWKLFGRIPPKECEKKGANQVLEDYQARHRPHISETRKKQDIEVLSTTALILENRPMNLPSKCPEEELRHKQEYEAMVEAAKKKELKEIRQKKKYLQQQLKTEDKRVACARYWNNEVLPNWDNMHNHKKTRELWWLGLPPNVRGKVWKLAIGNDLNITSELYEICLSRAKDKMNLFDMEPKDPSGPSETSSEPPSNKEASVELIKLDVARTFPQLCIFQKGGPYYELLHSLLGAYACYRPDVGYVQGMSFIAAVLLLNMDVADAFICFANLLNKPCQVAFFRMDESLMKSYFQSFEEFFKENMPILHEHFIHLSMTPEVYIIDWMFTLFSKSLPLDVACRVWDVFCRDGEEFLFRTALGLLKMHEDILIQLDFIHLAQFMTKLPDIISGEKLFRSIESVKMTIDKKRFIQVLASFRDAS